jgi:hypothetical protein
MEVSTFFQQHVIRYRWSELIFLASVLRIGLSFHTWTEASVMQIFNLVSAFHVTATCLPILFVKSANLQRRFLLNNITAINHKFLACNVL